MEENTTLESQKTNTEETVEKKPATVKRRRSPRKNAKVTVAPSPVEEKKEEKVQETVVEEQKVEQEEKKEETVVEPQQVKEDSGVEIDLTQDKAEETVSEKKFNNPLYTDEKCLKRMAKIYFFVTLSLTFLGFLIYLI